MGLGIISFFNFIFYLETISFTIIISHPAAKPITLFPSRG